jgi:transcriptional regulator with XRE-family HTH domain
VRGLTRAKLAEQSEVGYKIIQNIEHNVVRCPRSRTIQKLAKTLDVKPLELVRLISEPPGDPKKQGNRLRNLRIACELPPVELARQAGISQPYVYNLELVKYGASPNIIQKLAHALGVKSTEPLKATNSQHLETI